MSSCDLTVLLSLVVLCCILHNQDVYKKNSENILLGQEETKNLISRTTDCTLQEIGEFAVSPGDTKRKYQTTLDACKTDCENSPQCRAMYYINRMCFIIYKDAQRIELLGSSFFLKICHGIYCDLKLLEGQVSDLLQIVSTLSNDVKILKESLAKYNTTAYWFRKDTGTKKHFIFIYKVINLIFENLSENLISFSHLSIVKNVLDYNLSMSAFCLQVHSFCYNTLKVTVCISP